MAEAAAAQKYCQVHGDRIVEFYCKTCEDEICGKCVTLPKHRPHDLVVLEDVLARKRAEIRALNTKIQGQLHQHKKRYRENEVKITEACDDMRRQAEKTSRDARAYVDTWLEYSKDQVTELTDKLRDKYRERAEAQKQSADGNGDGEAKGAEYDKDITQLIKQLESVCSKGPPIVLPPLKLTEPILKLGDMIQIEGSPGDVERDLNAATTVMPDRERML